MTKECIRVVAAPIERVSDSAKPMQLVEAVETKVMEARCNKSNNCHGYGKGKHQ